MRHLYSVKYFMTLMYFMLIGDFFIVWYSSLFIPRPTLVYPEFYLTCQYGVNMIYMHLLASRVDAQLMVGQSLQELILLL